MFFSRIGVVAVAMVMIEANATPPVTQTFFPEKDLAQFLVENLDLSTFRNSLGPRRSEARRTFATLGIVPTQVQTDSVVLEDNAWFYSLRILRRTDINRDGFEDLEVCFTDRAKQGTYSTQQALLITRYSASSYAVALKYEVDGCETFAK